MSFEAGEARVASPTATAGLPESFRPTARVVGAGLKVVYGAPQPLPSPLMSDADGGRKLRATGSAGKTRRPMKTGALKSFGDLTAHCTVSGSRSISKVPLFRVLLLWCLCRYTYLFFYRFDINYV